MWGTWSNDLERPANPNQSRILLALHLKSTKTADYRTGTQQNPSLVLLFALQSPAAAPGQSSTAPCLAPGCTEEVLQQSPTAPWAHSCSAHPAQSEPGEKPTQHCTSSLHTQSCSQQPQVLSPRLQGQQPPRQRCCSEIIFLSIKPKP